MNEYITKLEEENKKLQETNSLYQERYGDIYETIEKEKNKVFENLKESDFSTATLNGNLFTANSGNVAISSGFIVQSSDINVWQPQDDAKKIQKEISDLKNIIINQRKPFYKRKIRVIMRKIKRKFK
jgi:predicted  nucleic acid-binding Zn-ribbon protein